MNRTNRKYFTMCYKLAETNPSVTRVLEIGDALYVSTKNKYIAIVTNNSKEKYGEKLQKIDYKANVSVRKTTHRWYAGNNETIRPIILSSIVFLRAVEQKRKDIVNIPFVRKFITNRASSKDEFRPHPIATLPDEHIGKPKSAE